MSVAILEEQAVPLLLWVDTGPLCPSGSAAYLYLLVKLLLDFAKLINAIEYMLGGTVLLSQYCPGDM